MLPGTEMMGCQDLAVPATVMRHVVHVESSANPYAIGVVGGRLQRQPKSLDEAVATARMLEAKGYNFSLGLAQVNRFNLDKYGLDTHEKAFDACANLSAGSRILAGCYARAGGHWGKAFSCYYSGNFVKGFQDGYVQKVYDSINRGTMVADNGSAAIPLAPPQPARMGTPQAAPRRAAQPDRIAMRSSPLNPEVSGLAPSAAEQPSASLRASASEVFIPQVQGPDETVAAPPASPPAMVDQADLRKGAQDSAFVF